MSGITLSNDSVQLVLKELVQKELDEIEVPVMAHQMAKEAIRELIDDELKESIRASAQKVFEAEVEIFLKEPVEIKNGWDSPVQFKSLQSFFKKELRSWLSNTANYSRKSIVEDCIKKQVSEIVKEHGKDIQADIQESVRKHLESIGGKS